MHACSARPCRARGVVGTLAGATFLSWMAACSPTLDWRETRLEASLVALFPCRPVGQSRQLVLAGVPVAMSLQACEAGGNTYAVGLADVRDPAMVGPALLALREASTGKLSGAAEPAASNAWSVGGMTPQAAAGRWRLGGQRPDGSPLAMETAVFARGTWVVQASVIGGKPQAQAVSPFFEGLRFQP